MLDSPLSDSFPFSGGGGGVCSTFYRGYQWYVTKLLEPLEYHRTTKNHNSYITIMIIWLTFFLVSFLLISFLILFGHTFF